MGSDSSRGILQHSHTGDKRGEKEKKPCAGCNKKQKENKEEVSSGVKAGESIRCVLCRKVIFIAKVFIPPKAPLKSEYLLWYDGTPVEYKAYKVCPHCWAFYKSISSKTKLTIP